MTIHFKKQNNQILILGNTYPHREAIKKLGGTFNSQLKLWETSFNEKSWGEVKRLCESLGGSCLNSEHLDEPETTFKAPTLAVPIRKTPIPKLESNPDKKALSVSELLEKASRVVASGFPGFIWVEGEIQNLNLKPQAVFFTLAEGVSGGNEANTTTVSASIWGNVLASLQKKYGREALLSVLADGQKVKVLASVTLYKGRAALSLTISDVDLDFTRGDLALNREKLLKELRLKGLDRANKQRPFPIFPLSIGLISAENSRGVTDFLHQLESGKYPGRVIFSPSPMQGEEVPKLFPRILKELEAKQVDVIIVTRGGGSLADLRWFDAKEVAYAIANCTVPVIAAIGHHEDVCIAEEISYLREKTPTAAAEAILSCFRSIEERLSDFMVRLTSLVDYRTNQTGHLIMTLPDRLHTATLLRLDRENERVFKFSSNLIHFAQQRIHLGTLQIRELSAKVEKESLRAINALEMKPLDYLSKLEKLSLEKLFKIGETISALELKLGSIDPSPWLNLGWTRLELEKRPVLSLAQLSHGDLVDARVKGGILKLRVEDIIQKTTLFSTGQNHE